MNHRPLVLGLLLAVTGSLGACKENAPTPPKADVAQLVPVGNVQVVIQQDTHVPADSAVFYVRVVGNGVPVAAYQGSLTFDASAIDFKVAETPTGSTGEFRIVNSTELASGVVRFAGFATEHFTDTEAFRLEGHFKPGKLTANLVGKLDVAGETSGAAIKASALKASNALYDMYSNVVVAR